MQASMFDRLSSLRMLFTWIGYLNPSFTSLTINNFFFIISPT